MVCTGTYCVQYACTNAQRASAPRPPIKLGVPRVLGIAAAITYRRGLACRVAVIRWRSLARVLIGPSPGLESRASPAPSLSLVRRLRAGHQKRDGAIVPVCTPPPEGGASSIIPACPSQPDRTVMVMLRRAWSVGLWAEPGTRAMIDDIGQVAFL